MPLCLMLMPGGFRIGRIFGIEVSLNWSWIIIFLLVTFNLSLGVFPILHPEWSTVLNWAVGVAASVLFFASVLAHEIAHSLVARSRGLPVGKITLFIFGGVSDIEKEPTRPSTEFLMALVGPLTSIVLGILFFIFGGIAAGGFEVLANNLTIILSGLNPLATLLLWLGPINVILGLFNLIPGFPLDGGRIFRSILWAITGDLKKATRWAAWTGQGFGWLFVLIGLAMAVGINVPFFGTGLIGGLWLVFIGWFLASIASQGYQQVVLEDILKNIKVEDIMRRGYSAVSPDISVNALIHEHIMRSEDRAFPVLSDGQLVGLVTLDDVRKAPREKWDLIRIGEIMTPRDGLEVVSPGEEAIEALRKIAVRDVNQLPVLENDRLTGMISRRDILLWMRTHSDEEIPE